MIPTTINCQVNVFIKTNGTFQPEVVNSVQEVENLLSQAVQKQPRTASYHQRNSYSGEVMQSTLELLPFSNEIIGSQVRDARNHTTTPTVKRSRDDVGEFDLINTPNQPGQKGIGIGPSPENFDEPSVLKHLI